jgi:hypothetical protein
MKEEKRESAIIGVLTDRHRGRDVDSIPTPKIQ